MTDEELMKRFNDIDRRFDAIDRRFDAVDQRFEAVDRRFDRMELLINERHAATRAHFDVVAEAMKVEVLKIAEGHGSLQQNVAALIVQQNRLEQRQDTLEVRQDALEFRQRKLEER